MDDARALLDSLMGGHRNADKATAKKMKGQAFKDDKICKFYLVGCCPQNEELFHNTRRDIGACNKVHSVAMKEELEAHAEKDKYKAEYERRLVYYLEDLVRSADDWVAKEIRNIKTENQQLEASGPGELARAEIKALKEEAQNLLNEAESLAEKGQFDASKEKMDQAAEVKDKAKYFEEKATSAKAENVCVICGTRQEADDAAFRHEDGKIHMGCVKIRGWLKDYKQSLAEREEKLKNKKNEGGKDDKDDKDQGRSRSGKRDKDRARSRSGRRRERSSDRGRRDSRRDDDRDRDRRDRGRDRRGRD